MSGAGAGARVRRGTGGAHTLNPRAASGRCGRARGRPIRAAANTTMGERPTTGGADRHNFVASDQHDFRAHGGRLLVRRPQSCARRPQPGLQRERREARVLCVCDSVCSVICVNGERLRGTCAGVSCRGAWGLRPYTRRRCEASCGAGGAHFAIGLFGGWAWGTPRQMHSWWNERSRNTALPAPTHELAEPLWLQPRSSCVWPSVWPRLTWWPTAQDAPGSSGGQLAGVDPTFTLHW